MKCPYIHKTEFTQNIEKTNPNDETGVYDTLINTRASVKRVLNISVRLRKTIERRCKNV